MKLEKSCGAVLYTQQDGQIMYVLVQQLSGFYGFPKGHMEGNETEIETARREVFEEVGIKADFDESFVLSDQYQMGGKKCKHVVFFLASYENQPIQYQKEELLGAKLFTYNQARKVLSFASSKNILKKVNDYLLSKK